MKGQVLPRADDTLELVLLPTVMLAGVEDAGLPMNYGLTVSDTSYNLDRNRGLEGTSTRIY